MALNLWSDKYHLQIENYISLTKKINKKKKNKTKQI